MRIKTYGTSEQVWVWKKKWRRARNTLKLIEDKNVIKTDIMPKRSENALWIVYNLTKNCAEVEEWMRISLFVSLYVADIGLKLVIYCVNCTYGFPDMFNKS